MRLGERLGATNPIFSFPNPVNEVASRTVAGSVAVLVVIALALQLPWVSAVLAYGFLARVATGPTLSPLGQFATRWAAPRISPRPRPVPGPPKRFAQGIGAVLSVTATVCWAALHIDLATYLLLAVLLVAATLESVLGFCLGCWIFARLMGWGVIPPTVCAACSDLGSRSRPSAETAP